MTSRKLYQYGTLAPVNQSSFPYNPKKIPGLGGVLHPKLYYQPITVSGFQPNTNLVSNDAADEDIVKPDEKLLNSPSDIPKKVDKVDGEGTATEFRNTKIDVGLNKPARLTKGEIDRLKRKRKIASTDSTPSKLTKHKLKIVG